MNDEATTRRPRGRPVGVKNYQEEFPRVAYSPAEVCARTGASQAFVNNLIQSGELESKRVGGRRFIPAGAVERTFGK